MYRYTEVTYFCTRVVTNNMQGTRSVHKCGTLTCTLAKKKKSKIYALRGIRAWEQGWAASVSAPLLQQEKIDQIVFQEIKPASKPAETAYLLHCIRSAKVRLVKKILLNKNSHVSGLGKSSP